jgi:CHAT domain-containing protein
MWKYRRKLTTFFLALLTLISTLIFPIFSANKVTGTEIKIKPTSVLISQVSNSLNLEQQGKKYYDIGNFSEAAKIWQQAADAYGKDEKGKNRNLINKAKALQSLGLYTETCSQLLQVFNIVDLKCVQLKSSDQSIDDKIIENLESQPNSLNKVIGLRLLGETLQKFGQLELSQQLLGITEIAAQQYPDQQSAIFISLGNIERAIGNRERDKLNYSWQIEFILGEKCNNEFNLHDKNQIKCTKNEFIDIKSYYEAFRHYNQARNYYKQTANNHTNPITEIQAELNQLSLLLDIQEWWNEQFKKSQRYKPYNWTELKDDLNNQIKSLWKSINSHLVKLPESHEIIRELVYAKINFAESLTRWRKNTQNDKLPQEQEIAQLLSTAIQNARTFKDQQAEALALTHLAKLYELQSQKENLTKKDRVDNLSQAKIFTEQALMLLNNLNFDNRQILYRNRHQLGRILRDSENIEGALTSYAEAWNILQSLRADLVNSADNQFSFRQNVEPVYREFIDLLLQAEVKNIDFKKLNLVLINNITTVYSSQEEKIKKNIPFNIARLVMESLQLAELDNFLQDPCLPPVEKLVQIENIDQKAAVVYPILLKDRLEVLLFQKNKSPYHYSVIKDSQTDFNQTIEKFADLIYSQVEDEKLSALEQQNRDRNEKFNENKEELLKVSQQLYKWLIEPLKQKNHLGNVETLVFVLDRVFQNIPLAALHDGENYLIKTYNIATSVGQQLKDSKRLEPKNIEILAAGLSKEVSVQGNKFPELKDTKDELENIKNLKNKLRISPKILCDDKEICSQEFTKHNVQIEMKSSPTVVHLSTHGVFSSNREQTFIVTSDIDDNTIKIDDFQNLLNPQGKSRNKNIELLVLSACQTASGDEKAALGMAGVALRSGANSTIASLWPVSAKGTTELMKKFYANLTNSDPEMSRAKALREAQRSLMEQDGYQHPFYWAAFTLIGSWL